MAIVNILTAGFKSPNGKAFLFPFYVFKDRLLEYNIKVRVFTKFNEKIYDCDVLIIDNRYHGFNWRKDKNSVLEKFIEYKNHVDKIIFFDTSDSTGIIEPSVIEYVDLYAKSQLLNDKEKYLKPHYGHRIYTDYYHKKFNIKDSKEEFSNPIASNELLNKLTVSWNSSLCDYSICGPFKVAAFDFLPINILLKFTDNFILPDVERSVDLNCRMGTQYSRETVSWQRRRISELLSKYKRIEKVNRYKYFKELYDSKVVVSPFGYGEITLKDFEVFITGGLLLKPDINHMSTWPELYIDGKTMVSFDWSFDGLVEKIEDILSDYESYIDIAIQGQENYRKYINQETGSEFFAAHLCSILSS